MNSPTENITPEKADYLARCFVNGAARHAATGNFEPITANFHERFLSHPWVRDSIKEGWDRELRAHMTQIAKLKLMNREVLGDIEALMPDKKWVSQARTDADRYRKAAEWRKANMPQTMDAAGILKRFGFGGQE